MNWMNPETEHVGETVLRYLNVPQIVSCCSEDGLTEEERIGYIVDALHEAMYCDEVECELQGVDPVCVDWEQIARQMIRQFEIAVN